jgi:hypothetical protein
VVFAVKVVSCEKEHEEGRGVAVDGWQWYRWIEDISAVILIPNKKWQWQY